MKTYNCCSSSSSSKQSIEIKTKKCENEEEPVEVLDKIGQVEKKPKVA